MTDNMKEPTPLDERIATLLLCILYAAPTLFWFWAFDGNFMGLGRAEHEIGHLLRTIGILSLLTGALATIRPNAFRFFWLGTSPAF